MQVENGRGLFRRDHSALKTSAVVLLDDELKGIIARVYEAISPPQANKQGNCIIVPIHLNEEHFESAPAPARLTEAPFWFRQCPAGIVISARLFTPHVPSPQKEGSRPLGSVQLTSNLRPPP